MKNYNSLKIDNQLSLRIVIYEVFLIKKQIILKILKIF